MEITAGMIKEVRGKTGAGIMDCKNALKKSDGDFDGAITYLREKGLAAAKKKGDRIAAEGSVGTYIHPGDRVGVLVELNCETDFVARTEEFKSLLKDVAMHVAAASPLYVRREEVDKDLVEKERAIFKAQALESGKPEKIIDRIVDGKLEKFYADICLLEQSFVKNPDITIDQLITEKIAKLGEHLSIRRFVRYNVGEGMEKRSTDFASEVKAAAQ
ncbi:MAG: translation elongation factor Ts [Thermodesulfobacteriota bacterium]